MHLVLFSGAENVTLIEFEQNGFPVLSKILYPNSGIVLFDEDLNVASFQGLDGAIGSLVIMAWNRKANIGSQEMHQYLNFHQVVQAMDVPAVSFHYCSRELLSTATFKPCNIMLPLFCQREWEGRWRRRWWWRWRWRWLEEVIKVKECGLKTGDVKLENPRAPWLVVLFNIWRHICQALDESHVELAEGQKAGTSDDEHKRSKSCSLDSPTYPSNTLPKGPTPIMICT